ncbi:MAG TPA: hypothetical protein VGV87_30790 [Blastocatellia bacterium]|nr:hypothetical protein [Blastocatellia bacterium]
MKTEQAQRRQHPLRELIVYPEFCLAERADQDQRQRKGQRECEALGQRQQRRPFVNPSPSVAGLVVFIINQCS